MGHIVALLHRRVHAVGGSVPTCTTLRGVRGLRVLAKTLALAAVAAILLVVLVPPALYRIGLANVQGRPQPPQPTDVHSDDYHFIANLKFPHRVVLRKLNPWTYPFLAETEDPAIWIVAEAYNIGHLKRREAIWWHLSGASLMIWISRNWSQDQIVTAAAAQLKGP